MCMGGVIFLTFWAWLPTVSSIALKYSAAKIPGMGPKTVMVLVVIYITMRVARLLEADRIIPLRYLYFAFTGLMFAFGGIVTYFANQIWVTKPDATCWEILKYTCYDCPFVFLAACVLFLLFNRWQPSQRITAVAGFMGPSMLAVYLIHICSTTGITLTYSKPIMWTLKYFPDMSHPIVILLVTVYCFILCLCIDFMRRGGLTVLKWKYKKSEHVKAEEA